MLRRLKSPSRRHWYFVLALVLLLIGRWSYGRIFSDPGRPATGWADGDFTVERILDPTEFLVRFPGSETPAFRVRLAGVRWPAESPPELHGEALEFCRAFLASSAVNGTGEVDPNRQPVWLRFDRTHEARDGVALAYLQVDERILNVELCRAGFALPQAIAGNSSSIKRRIERAADEARQGRRGLHRKGPD